MSDNENDKLIDLDKQPSMEEIMQKRKDLRKARRDALREKAKSLLKKDNLKEED